MISLVEWRNIIVLHVRHAFWCIVLMYSAKWRREIFIFEVLTKTGARSSKSFILCLYMKIIRAKKAKVHSVYFAGRDQHGIIAKDLTQSSILIWRFPCSCRRSFLNSLIAGLVCRTSKIWELKQTRRRRKRERHLKMWLRVSAIIFQLFKLIMLEKCVLTILELNWNQRFGHRMTKLNICHHMLTYVVHTTTKQVISRRRKNENVYKMSKNENCACKACKTTLFHWQICIFVGFLLPSSSWLLN